MRAQWSGLAPGADIVAAFRHFRKVQQAAVSNCSMCRYCSITSSARRGRRRRGDGEAAKLLCGGLGGLVIDVPDHDLRTRQGEALGNCETQSRRTTCHDGVPAVEIQPIHASSRRCYASTMPSMVVDAWLRPTRL